MLRESLDRFMVDYYRNVNLDLLERIPANANHVLEIGVGAGHLGEAYLRRNPNASYDGVELVHSIAQEAFARLSRVTQGDIEAPAVMNHIREIYRDKTIEALVFGDVLEHFKEPWQVLRELRLLCAPNAVCVACIPNVSHWSLVQEQLAGRWNYAKAGLLDRTHLRFFTLDSTLRMFNEAGWSVIDAKPRVLWPEKTKVALEVFRSAALALGIPFEELESNLSAFQWVIRAVNGNKPKPITIAALALKKTAGVNEARIDYPLATLNTLPSVRAVWSSEKLEVPSGDPGVLILHRQFVNTLSFQQAIERFISKGWVVISEIDDDPHHWSEYVESEFYAFRAVHAVTVSSEPLAAMIQQWNSNVKVFDNAIFELPTTLVAVANDSILSTRPVRIFFGALNRLNDWLPIIEGIRQAALQLKNEVHWVVVHDQAFFNALPSGVEKSFFEMLTPSRYLEILASCDISLLPLADTKFNLAKSDLKFIESCAAGSVPVCSPVVYGREAAHTDLAIFATSADEWHRGIVTLVRNQSRRRSMAKLGINYVKSRRLHSQQMLEREVFYKSLMETRADLERQRCERMFASGLIKA